MVTKTEQAAQLWVQGQKLKALSIFKTFRMGLTKEEQRAITVTYECLQNPKTKHYYESLQVNTHQLEEQAAVIIDRIIQNKQK